MFDDRQIALGVVSILLGIGLLVLLAFQTKHRNTINHDARTGREQERSWLQPIGFVARLVVYAALFVALYFYAPKDILHTPLANLTLSDILNTVGWLAIGTLLVLALFTPSQNDETKDLWGLIGLLACFCGIIFVVYVRPDIIESMIR